MPKILLTLALFLSLSGCTLFHVYRMDIQQGNIITSDNTAELRLGMTQTQVENILGTPMLTTVFDANRIDYVYTNQPGSKQVSETTLTLTFKHGILYNMQMNKYSAFAK